MSDLTVSHMGYTLRVERDADSNSPLQEFGLNTKVFVGRSNRYFTGSDDATDPTEMQPEEIALCVPIYGFVHSGQTVSTKPFSCPWDSGQIGFAYLETSNPECTDKSVEELRAMIDGDIEVWRQWMEGDVHYYSVTNDQGEVVDSLGGTYGDPLEALRDHCCLSEEIVEGLIAAAQAARVGGMPQQTMARRGSLSR